MQPYQCTGMGGGGDQHASRYNCHGASTTAALEFESFSKKESLCDVHVQSWYLVRDPKSVYTMMPDANLQS